MDPDYQAAVAGLANALPLPPRPLPPWAPSVSFVLTLLILSVLLFCVAALFALESWLRLSGTEGDGDRVPILSVSRQGELVVYEYAAEGADGVRRTERITAPPGSAPLGPGSVLRVWPARSLLSRLVGRRVIPEPMRASHRSLAFPLAGFSGLALIGAVLCALWSHRAWSDRRLLSEGQLVRGEVVTTEVRSRLVKPRLAVVMRIQGPSGPLESLYVFRSDRSPVRGTSAEPAAGDPVWVAFRPDDATRSLPWAFDTSRRRNREPLK